MGRFCQLDRLGLSVAGQYVADDHTVLRFRVVQPNDPVERDCWCHRCRAQGVARDTVVRELAQVPEPVARDDPVRYRALATATPAARTSGATAAPRRPRRGRS